MLDKVFDPDVFKKDANEVLNKLVSFLIYTQNNAPVKIKEPSEYNWKIENKVDINSIIDQLLYESQNSRHPHYVGNMTGPSLPIAVLGDFVSEFLNNCLATFNGAPSQVTIEREIIKWMLNKIGFNNGDGFFTSGGSLANLTALLAIRQIKTSASDNIWENGLYSSQPIGIMTSEDSHYSITKAAQIMGLGKKNVIIVKTNDDYQIDYDDLNKKYNDSKIKIVAFIASAPNTGPGIFDDLEKLGNFCKDKNIWLHVDGAHGASSILANKYKYLLNGIEYADSITWDTHKMMAMPQLATAILFKNKDHSFKAVRQDAPYLYDLQNDDPLHLSKRTIECSKNSLAFRLYLSLAYYGEEFFSDYITYLFDLSRSFSKLIQQDSEFELMLEPMANVICFRYKPKNYKGENLNQLQNKIHKRIIESGEFYLVKTKLKEIQVLRCVLMNPSTKLKHLQNLLKFIKELEI